MQTSHQRSSGSAGRGAARLLALLAAALLLGLAGCGGGSGDSGDDTGSLDIEGSQTAGNDEKQLKELVADYGSALDELGKTKAAKGSLDGVLTPELAEEHLANYRKNVFDRGRTLVGHWKMKVQDIEVEGDTATMDVCSDGREVYAVDAQKPQVGEDSMAFGDTPVALTATRTDDGWLVSALKTLKGDEGPCE